MEKKIFFIALVFFTVTAHAQVNYQVDASEEKVEINVSARLECEESSENCPVNIWSLKWRTPEDAEILSVRDSIGAIEDYTMENGLLKLQTNKGPKRRQETVSIEMEVDKDAREITEGLYRRQISLPSFPEKETTGEISVKNLLSAKLSSGFEKSYSNSSIRFSGEGALNARINFGDGKKVSEYSFFGGNPRNASLAYRVAVGTTGLRQSYESIPVAVLPGEEYNRTASTWSQAEYSSGTIIVRSGLGDEFAPVLAEETVHAFNDEFFSFDRTSSAWLDEGIAGYTQAMVRKKLQGKERARELFGEDLEYRDRRKGELYRITKFSKGEKEKLWKYYQENRSFMKSWTPTKPQNRDFGYAYSELIVRNYVSQNNSLRELYSEVEPRSLTSNEDKWSYYSRYLDLTPCKFSERSKFDRCLERINSYDYPVLYASELPEKDQKTVEVRQLEIENSSQDQSFRNERLYSQSFVNSLLEFLRDLWSSL